jgi:DNA-binding response OmpR family regulator
MLTARDTVLERVEGFRQGADDYLCKPFNVEELAARLQAICRRSRPLNRYVLQYSDVELDLITRLVRRNKISQTLSAREAELLAYFMRHPEEPLAREQILEQVWGDEAEDDSNVLNVYVNYLRNKIEAALYPRIIHTVRGLGYILSDKAPEEVTENLRFP